MLTMIQDLEHSIRTAYGDSDLKYCKDIWATPMNQFQGLCKWNEGGLKIWAVISIPILQILKQELFGTFFQTALFVKDIIIVGYMFVEDTDLI